MVSFGVFFGLCVGGVPPFARILPERRFGFENMKKCPQCAQLYSDDTNFCLSDGATLVPVSDSFASESEMPTIADTEMPTVVRQTAAPTVYIQPTTPSVYGEPPPVYGEPPSYGNAPYAAPVSYAPAAPPEKSNTLLIALAVGFLALVVGGAVVGLVMYGVFKPDEKEPANVANSSNSAERSNKNTSAEQKSGGGDDDALAENLKQQQEKLDKDKKKLEDERKALEAKKKQSQQTPPPSSVRTAVIIDPPSNIRATPNGTVICVARSRGTVVNILGSTGISDSNGTWYYTDYCGRQGVIHSSQIRF